MDPITLTLAIIGAAALSYGLVYLFVWMEGAK